MSLYKKVKMLKGVMKIRVEGFFMERFINLCLQENIEIWDIKRLNEGTVDLKLQPIHYEKVCEIATITKCNIEILEKNGIPFIVNRYKHRKLFAAFIAIVAMGITVVNMFVWKVEVVGEFDIPIEEVYSFLADENIQVGSLKKQIDIEKSKTNILLARDDIAWIGISLKGNQVTVEIVPKEQMQEDPYKGTVGNIVAEKGGIVEKIYVANGTANVHKGEVIEPGTILINGIYTGEDQTSRKVRAEGEVVLRTTYVEKTKVPFQKDIVSKTGRVQKNYDLKLNFIRINLLNQVTNFEKYDTITQEKVFSLFGKIRTPICLIEIRNEEIKVDQIKYTAKQAEDLAIVSNHEKLKNTISKAAERLDYKNKTWQNDEYLEVETTVQCLEKVGTYVKIEE